MDILYECACHQEIATTQSNLEIDLLESLHFSKDPFHFEGMMTGYSQFENLEAQRMIIESKFFTSDSTEGF